MNEAMEMTNNVELDAMDTFNEVTTPIPNGIRAQVDTGKAGDMFTGILIGFGIGTGLYILKKKLIDPRKEKHGEKSEYVDAEVVD